MKPTMMQKRFDGFRGFSLTETAIVLGVVGLVVGAIWATASVVRERQPIQDTVQLITEIASNVRGVYSGFPNTATVPDTIAKQITANLFPASVVNTAKDNTVNGWGGTLFIRFPDVPRYGFSIEIDIPATIPLTVRTAACLGLITRLPATATTYAGGISDTLATGNTLKIDPVQGNAPSLAFVRDGATWENVTSSSVDDIVKNTADCTGAAFYFRL